MEEVWKDISLSTPFASHHHLHHHHPHHHLRHPSSSPFRGGIILQDFLASAAVAPPQPPTPPPPLPPTALSLSSTLEFTYLGGPPPPSNSSSGDDSRDAAARVNSSAFLAPPLPDPFAAPADIFSFGARKSAAPECATGGDRRHRRMIKNRESAARSRARKQAYTNELELALSHLQRENEMLKKRQEELNLRLAMAAQVPGRPTIQRCHSAPL